MISPHRTNADDRGRLAALSPRERRVLALVARGRSAKGIAQILEISPRTVNLHAASILRKLGAENRLEAVAIAVRGGLLAPDR
jgi:DNA-binding NarL/FixJ family response regulator